MPTTKTLKPGQKGTDEERREHLKTVQLVVRRRSRDREAESPRSQPVGGQIRAGSSTHRVALRVGWRERDVQQRVRSAGGHWDRGRGLWIIERDAAERLELLDRVAGGGGRGWMGCRSLGTRFPGWTPVPRSGYLEGTRCLNVDTGA